MDPRAKKIIADLLVSQGIDAELAASAAQRLEHDIATAVRRRSREIIDAEISSRAERIRAANARLKEDPTFAARSPEERALLRERAILEAMDPPTNDGSAA